MMETSTKTSGLLISTGCLTEIEVYLAREYIAAKARLDGGCALSGTLIVQQFDEACADIQTTMPSMDTLDAISAHFI